MLLHKLKLLIFLFISYSFLNLPFSAQATIPKTIIFTSEYNTSVAFLSSASPASGGIGEMPTTYQSLTVQYFVNDAPESGRTINFKVTNPQGQASNLVVLDRTSAITDAKGKCRVIINGGGQIVNNETQVYVTAFRIRPGTSIIETSSNVIVELKRYNTNFAVSPAWHGPVEIPVKYDNSLLSRMSGYAAQSQSDFTVQNHISFTQNTNAPTLRYREIREPDELLFGVTKIDLPVWEVQYNMYALDEGDPISPNFLIAPWSPLNWRHHVQSTANHEMGHYLRFNHNGLFKKSLMWFSLDRYFVWNTEKPRDDSEMTPLQSVY